MAMENIGARLKKLVLAGIGVAAVMVEKSQQIVDNLFFITCLRYSTTVIVEESACKKQPEE